MQMRLHRGCRMAAFDLVIVDRMQHLQASSRPACARVDTGTAKPLGIGAIVPCVMTVARVVIALRRGPMACAQEQGAQATEG